MKRFLLMIAAVLCCHSAIANPPLGREREAERQKSEWTSQLRQSGTYVPKPKYNTSKKSTTGRNIISVPVPKKIVPKHAIEVNIDEATGMATIRWDDGSAYQGHTYYGEMKGVGTMIYPDGCKFVGLWDRDLPNGNGTFQTPEGITFTTNFKNGKPHGKGVIQAPDGSLYTARWKDGKLKEKSIKPLEEK